jgi:hypothetical protein
MYVNLKVCMNTPMLRKVLVCTVLLSSTFRSGNGLAQTESNSVQVNPELIYRFGALSIREESSLYDEGRDRDVVDQFYGSLTFRKDLDYTDTVFLQPAIYTLRENPSQIRTRFDQAYVQVALGEMLSLTAGKKLEIRGAAFMTNPSDLLNEDRDILDPLNQREGKGMVRMTWSGSGRSLGLGFLPKPGGSKDEGRVWMIGQARLGNFDSGFQLINNRGQKSTVGLTGSWFWGEKSLFYGEYRYQSKRRPAADQPEQEFIAEQSKSIQQASLGLRQIMSDRNSVSIEYYMNNGGASTTELLDYFKSQEALRAEEKTPNDPFARLVGRDYAGISYHGDKLPYNLSLTTTYIANIHDKSSFISANFKYHRSELFSLAYSPVWFTGSRFTEFGENPVAQVHYLVVNGLM